MNNDIKKSRALVPASQTHFGTQDPSTILPVTLTSQFIGQRLNYLGAPTSQKSSRHLSARVYRQAANRARRRMPAGMMQSMIA